MGDFPKVIERTLALVILATALRQYILDHMPMDVGEAEAAALVLEDELRVIDAQQVQDRRLQIVDVDGAGGEGVFGGIERLAVVVGDVVAVVVGAAVGDAGLDAAAGHPDGEAAGVVVAAVVGRREGALRVAGAAELAAPDHERVVEQAALLEILHQRGGGLVGLAALVANAGGETAVVVPALVVELDEADAAFGQAARQQAVGGECAGGAAVGAVEVERGVGLLGEIGRVGDARLHAERHFVLGDPRLDLGIEFLFELPAVEGAELVEHRAAAGAADAVGVAEVEDRLGAGAELDALVLRVEEAGAPEAGVERLVAPASR